MRITGWSAAAVSAVLAACAPALPERKLPDSDEAVDRSASRFSSRPPLERITLPGSFLVSEPTQPPVPARIADRPISIEMPAGAATLDDLIFVLDEAGVSTAFSWQGLEQIPELREARLPFRRYNGTIGGLLDKLKNSLNLATWYQNGAVFIAPSRRYAVSLPPVQGTMSDLAGEISAMGAEDVQPSLIGGQLQYTAAPALNDTVIEPFLRRTAHNLSEVTIQVALATVSITESERRGFDWDRFATEITENLGEEATSFSFGRLSDDSLSTTIVNDQFELFGTQLTLSVSGALDFLSNFGNTTIEQNIELRSISGQPVEVRDQQNIPFVEQIRETATQNSNSAQVDFGEVETGLTVTIVPRYQARENLVTMEIQLDITEFIEFLTIEVPLGDTTSDVQRPITETRALTDIIRVPAGQTVMIGGLTEENVSDNRNAPFALWRFGNSDRTITRDAVFIVLRPIVTRYEFADNPLMTAQQITPRSLPLIPPNPGSEAPPANGPIPLDRSEGREQTEKSGQTDTSFGDMLDSILQNR